MPSTRQHLPRCLRCPSLSLLQEQPQLTRCRVPGVLRVALEQGNHGGHCVPHEYFFSQLEKEGKEAVVVAIKVDIDVAKQRTHRWAKDHQ